MDINISILLMRKLELRETKTLASITQPVIGRARIWSPSVCLQNPGLLLYRMLLLQKERSLGHRQLPCLHLHFCPIPQTWKRQGWEDTRRNCPGMQHNGDWAGNGSGLCTNVDWMPRCQESAAFSAQQRKRYLLTKWVGESTGVCEVYFSSSDFFPHKLSSIGILKKIE